MSQSTVFVLGGGDDEMAAIRALLAAIGHPVLQATKDGKPVHGGNAYEATWMAWPDGRPVKVSEYAHLARTHAVVLIECGGASPFPHEGQTVGAKDSIEGGYGHPVKVVRIDHHRPGDPGYGKPPEEFWLASSLGQVLRWLEDRGEAMYWKGSEPFHEGDSFDRQPEGWQVGDEFFPAGRLRLTAAADHCLGAAYAGRCPGVNPDDLMRHRAAEKARFQKRPVEAVMTDIEAARALLQATCLEQGKIVNGLEDYFEVHGVPFVDLHDWSRHIPELPEAAARYGFAYITTVTEPTGRVKDVLGGATTPELVRAWMEEVRAQGRQVYGDPERGFAGAYRQ